MEKPSLNRLFYNYLQDIENESFEDSELIARLENNAYNVLIQPIIKENYNTGIELEKVLSDLSLEKERLGFINGFILATKLWKECS